jgi:hypothetical protein
MIACTENNSQNMNLHKYCTALKEKGYSSLKNAAHCALLKLAPIGRQQGFL